MIPYSIEGIETDERTNKAGLLTVRFRIQDICNLSCEYCSEHGTVKSPSAYSIMVFLVNIQKIVKQRGYTGVQFFLWGGEPFTNQDLLIEFLKLVHHLQIDVDQISILTNCTHNLSTVLMIAGVLAEVPSYNRTLMNPPRSNPTIVFDGSIHLGSYKQNQAKINKTLEQLSEKRYFTETIKTEEISIMIRNKKDLIPAKAIIDQYPNLPLVLAPIRNSPAEKYMMDSFEYSGSLEAGILVKDKPESISRKVKYPQLTSIGKWENISTLGMRCNAGTDSIEIDTNGDIYRCHNDWFAKDQAGTGTSIGNIFIEWTDEYLKKYLELTEPVICKHELCICEWGLKKIKED